MTFNSATIIPETVRSDLETLLTTVTAVTGPTCSADQMERHLFQQLLQMGAKLLQLYFDMQSQAAPRQEAVNQQGERLPYHSDKRRAYYAIFGELEIRRPYFYRQGAGGTLPLDGELGLGEGSYSDFLRELHAELSVYMPFGQSVATLKRLLGIGLSTRCLQQFVDRDAADAAAYYEQKPPPAVAEEGPLLVIQADGKGVPIIKASAHTGKVRLKRGQARSRKKAVTVTALYTIQPAPRSVADVMGTLLAEATTTPPPARTRPQHKQLWGTLAGKPAALDRLQAEVDKRWGDQSQQGLMLCDGDKALQAHLQQRWPGFTLILDFIHAYEYLWQVASALFGQDDPQRLAWVKQRTRTLLEGQAAALARHFRQLAQAPGRTASQRQILQKVATYYENNHAYMDYGTYLQRGWPIASGVIEGACRHFVKDRLELSGMRWSLDGAEKLLHLRAVAVNGDWDAYHRFRKQRRQQRLYGSSWPDEIPLPALAKLVRHSATTCLGKGPPCQGTQANPAYEDLPLAV